MNNIAPNFQYRFAKPDPPPVTLGFPRQIQKDRPPFLGYFQNVTPPQKQILVAIMHSPSPGTDRPTKAAQNMALVPEFSLPDACVLLGDFNVPYSINASVPNSNGATAFGALINDANFQQLLPKDPLSSLTKSHERWVGISSDDCKSQPYDQIFSRGQGVSFVHERVEDILVECMSPGTLHLSVTPDSRYLVDPLAQIHGRNNGRTPPAGYHTVEDGFEAYRVFVSDHLPVVVEVVL